MLLRKRHPIRDKDAKDIAEALTRMFGADFKWDERRVERAEGEGYVVILVDGVPMAFMEGGETIPTVRGLLEFGATNRYVGVDEGAVAFLLRGADVMSPGIVEADPAIQPGDMVWVREAKHKRPLAVGRALITGPEMVASKKGKAVRTLHHLRDKLWEITQEE